MCVYRNMENAMQLTDDKITDMKQHVLNLYNAIPKSKRPHYLWDLDSLDSFLYEVSMVVKTLNDFSELISKRENTDE